MVMGDYGALHLTETVGGHGLDRSQAPSEGCRQAWRPQYPVECASGAMRPEEWEDIIRPCRLNQRHLRQNGDKGAKLNATIMPQG